MVQTLPCEETLVSEISKLSIFDQFAQTIFVEENQGIIEIENSHRELNTIKFVRTELAYKLKNHRIISKKINSQNIVISDMMGKSTISVDKSICRCVSSDLNKLFVDELNHFESTQSFEFNLFNQNFVKRLFAPNKKKDLINKVIEISDYMSWAIIPYNLVNLFYESDEVKLSKEGDEKLLQKLGTLNSLELFVNHDDNSGKIYFGNYNSILILANKFMNVFENEQGTNYNFEYLFIQNGVIKSLQVK